jgi:hypothetical protein
MLNIDGIARAATVNEPFEHFVAQDVLPRVLADSLLADFPHVTGSGSFAVSMLKCGPTFQSLVEEIKSPEFAVAIGDHFSCDLTGLSQLITVRGQSGPKDGFVHTDSEWKVVTALLYLNPGWQEDSGRLRLLRSADLDDVAVEVPPDWGTLIVFRRSARSFHGHKLFCGARRLVQVNWATDAVRVERELHRHQRSSAIKSAWRKLWPDEAKPLS